MLIKPPVSPESKFSDIGIASFGYLSTADIVFSDEVRTLCKGNRCQNYGRTWCCPPAVGSLEECRKQCLAFSHAMVFSSAYPLEDSYDLEGMHRGHRSFKQVCDALYARLEAPFLLLSNEGCIRCPTCTYPDAPCRFPETLFPSLEGYGILVYETAKRAGVSYRMGENSVSYFGLLCYGLKA